MTYNYKHIKVNLTPEQVEERVIALATKLCLVENDTISDEVWYQLSMDVRLLDGVERAGIDLGRTHDIEQWAFFSEARDAKRFAREVTTTGTGYRARVVQSECARTTVVLRNRSALRPETVGRMTTSMRALAAKHHGDYDGFEASINEPRAGFMSVMDGDMTAEELGSCGIAKRPGFELHPNTA